MTEHTFVPPVHRAPKDIYTETEASPNTLANLGPLAPMAGTWYGSHGIDINPKADGPETKPFNEYYELEPVDAQNNGPQVLYGLRYHTHIVEPGQLVTYHDQVGYWLWDPAQEMVYMTGAIPRAQAWLACGKAKATDREFTVYSTRDTHVNTFASGPFLEAAFQTTDFKMTVTINDDGSWSYREVTLLIIPGVAGPFEHVDSNTLHMVACPRPNAGQIDAGLWPYKAK